MLGLKSIYVRKRGPKFYVSLWNSDEVLIIVMGVSLLIAVNLALVDVLFMIDIFMYVYVMNMRDSILLIVGNFILSYNNHR